MRGLGIGLWINRGGKRGEFIITATSNPTGQLIVGENASADLASFSTFDNTTNYASTAGTISSVDYQINGVSNAGSGVLADGDIPSFLVTDSAANTRRFTISTVVHTAPVATGALADQSFTENTGVQTYDTSGDFTGSDLTYSVNSVTGVTINSSTGVVSFDTDTMALQTGTVITVTATNSGGSDTSSFNVAIEVAGAVSALLLEDGFTLLLESGDRLLLEA